MLTIILFTTHSPLNNRMVTNRAILYYSLLNLNSLPNVYYPRETFPVEVAALLAKITSDILMPNIPIGPTIYNK